MILAFTLDHFDEYSFACLLHSCPQFQDSFFLDFYSLLHFTVIVLYFYKDSILVLLSYAGFKISNISVNISPIYRTSVRFEVILTIDNRLIEILRKC